MLNYKNFPISINNTGLSALSISFSSSLNRSNSNLIGYFNKPIIQTGPKSYNISINYVVEVDFEPNFNQIANIKASTGILPSSIIDIGSLRTSGYLSSYSLSVNPNQFINASVNYICFDQIIGDLVSPTPINLRENQTKNTAHSWTTYINHSNSTDELSSNYDLNYSFQADWFPSYKVNSKYPYEVTLIGGKESISLSSSGYINPENNSTFNYPYQFIDINSLNLNNKIQIPTENFLIESNTFNVNVDDIFRSNLSLAKFF